MEGRRKSSVDPTAPHFFKIILQSAIESGKLVIPEKFARKYGAELSKFDCVLLKVPEGGAWRVELRRADGVVWLEKGWLDFVKFYSIRAGHFLVFRHEPGSPNELGVIVFDKTATEIEYPKKPRAGLLSPVELEDIDEDDGDVVSIDTSTYPEEPPLRINRSRVSKSRMMMRSRTQGRGPLKGEDKVKALERANSFRSSNPYISILMQSSFVHPSCRLNMPARFLQTYLGNKRRGQMKLHVSGDKIWTIGYYICGRERCLYGRSNSGWRAFVVDNGLGLGDVCIFEVIRNLRSISFKVSIFKAPKVAKVPCTSRQGRRGALSMLQDRSRGKSKDKEKNASVNMEQDTKQGRVKAKDDIEADGHTDVHNLPTAFFRETGLWKKDNALIRDPKGRIWPVKVRVHMQQVDLASGWCEFIKANGLVSGDAIQLEYIGGKGNVINAEILSRNPGRM